MKKRDLIVYAAVFLVLVGLFTCLPPLGIWSNHEAVKFIQMKNFHLHGTLAIDYPGRSIGLGPSDLRPGQLLMAEKNNSLYVIFPPLFPWLSSLFYPLMGDRVTHFLPLLAFFLSFMASPVFFFALTFFEHVPALFLVISSLYFLVRYFMASSEPTDLFLSSMLLGAGIFFRTEVLFLAAAVFISQGWSFLKRKQYRTFAISSAGLLVPVAAYGILNTINYGTFSGLHLDFNGPIHHYSIRSALKSVIVFGGFAGAALFCTRDICERVQRVRIYAFLTLLFVVFIFSYFDQSPIVILFAQFPVGFFLFLGPEDPIKDFPADREMLRDILLGTSFAFMALIAFFMGDMHPNVRFALPLIPLIVTIIAVDWERIFATRLMVAVFAVLLLLSMKSLATSLPTNLLYYKTYNAQRVEWLTTSTQPGDVIIFDDKALMHHAGPLFFDRLFVVENDPDRLTSLFDRLKGAGVSQCFFQSNHAGYEASLKAYNPAVAVDVMPLDAACSNSCGSGLYLYHIPLTTD
jgi:hypothetical protein